MAYIHYPKYEALNDRIDLILKDLYVFSRVLTCSFGSIFAIPIIMVTSTFWNKRDINLWEFKPDNVSLVLNNSKAIASDLHL